DDGHCTAEELIEEPVSQHEPGGHVEQEDWWKPNQHASARIEDEVGTKDAGYGSAGSDGGKARTGIDQDLRGGRGDSAGEIENQIFEVAEEVFNVIAEDP